MTNFLFLKGHSNPYVDLIKEIEKGDCEIKVKSLRSKSWKQVKGIYRLCSLLAPRFTESYGVGFDLNEAKLAVKLMFGYVRQATIEESLAEALNIKQIKEAKGEKMKTGQFRRLVEIIQKDLTKPKSFEEATKEEMMDLIDKIEELGRRMNWPEVKLESADKRALMEYFNNLK